MKKTWVFIRGNSEKDNSLALNSQTGTGGLGSCNRERKVSPWQKNEPELLIRYLGVPLVLSPLLRLSLRDPRQVSFPTVLISLWDNDNIIYLCSWHNSLHRGLKECLKEHNTSEDKMWRLSEQLPVIHNARRLYRGQTTAPNMGGLLSHLTKVLILSRPLGERDGVWFSRLRKAPQLTTALLLGWKYLLPGAPTPLPGWATPHLPFSVWQGFQRTIRGRQFVEITLHAGCQEQMRQQ